MDYEKYNEPLSVTVYALSIVLVILVALFISKIDSESRDSFDKLRFQSAKSTELLAGQIMDARDFNSRDLASLKLNDGLILDKLNIVERSIVDLDNGRITAKDIYAADFAALLSRDVSFGAVVEVNCPGCVVSSETVN